MKKTYNKKMVIILMGPPGSGKGTQASLLQERFGLEYVGSGELLRARKRKKDFTGVKIGKVMDKGYRIPTPVIFYLWMQKFELFAKKPGLKGFVIDGSPRTLMEAQILDTVLEWYGWDKNRKIIYVKLSSQESIWRLTKRRMCVKCGRLIPYIGDFKKLKECDKCGGRLVARPDDTKQGVQKRLAWFKTDVLPAINYYRQKSMLKEVKGEKPIENVFNDILKAIKE